MSWIKVEDQIPNYYHPVFVYTTDNLLDIGVSCEIKGEFVGFKTDVNDEYYLNNVTHWKPIEFPNKPKSDNE